MTEDLPMIKGKINSLENSWENNQDRELKKSVYSKMNKLFKLYREVQGFLPDFNSYDSDYAFDAFMAMEMVEEDGVIDEQYDELMVDLTQLIANQRDESKSNSNAMISSFENLRTNLTYLGIGLILCGIFIAWFTTRSITSPVYRLKGVIQSLGAGVIPKESLEHSNDEIGDMTEALNTLMGSLTRTRDFASATGTGNFGVDYELLGPKDEMGMALLQMRDGLAQNERQLEAKVEQRTVQLLKKTDELQEKKCSNRRALRRRYCQHQICKKDPRFHSSIKRFNK